MTEPTSANRKTAEASLLSGKLAFPRTHAHIGDPKMPNARNYTKLHAAAYHFSHISRRVDSIANALSIAEKTVRRYANDPEWEISLDQLGYVGERVFDREPTRNTARDAGMKYKHAHDLYIQLYGDGTPPHKLATRTAATLDIPTEKVRRWAKDENWVEKNGKEG